MSRDPLPAGTVGTAYSQTIVSSGTPMKCTLAGGALPAGLSLGVSSGVIGGTPTTAGVFAFTVQAANPAGSNATTLSLTIQPKPIPPTISTASLLAAGMVGTAYSQTIVSTGTTPIKWTISGGALPAGLSLDVSSGVISGTPTTARALIQATSSVSAAFTVQAENAGGSSALTFRLTIQPKPVPPTIVNASPLAAATVGTAYVQKIAVSGTAPIQWTITSGALPAGLSLAVSSGKISGTPTTAGVFAFTIQVANAAGSKATAFSLTIQPKPIPPTISTASPLAAGMVGTAYSQTIVSSGTTPIKWTISGGALPAGLSLDVSSGVISG